MASKARKHLIDTGTRNRLVHTNRKTNKPATMQLRHGDVDGLFRRLVLDRRNFRFVADPRATERERSRIDEPDSDEYETIEVASALILQHVFATRLGEAALQKKLTRFARESKTLEEEQGVNILFLAIGFLRWFEEEASAARPVRSQTFTAR